MIYRSTSTYLLEKRQFGNSAGDSRKYCHDASNIIIIYYVSVIR